MRTTKILLLGACLAAAAAACGSSAGPAEPRFTPSAGRFQSGIAPIDPADRSGAVKAEGTVSTDPTAPTLCGSPENIGTSGSGYEVCPGS